MHRRQRLARGAAPGLLAAALLLWPCASSAQEVVGRALAVKTATLGFLGGSTTQLASTGSLGGPSDVRGASQSGGSVPGLLSAEALTSATIGWPDQVSSEASLADLALSVAGVPISAGFVGSRATSLPGGGGSADSLLLGLSINGLPVEVTGAPNQTIAIPGGRVVLNEQRESSGVTTVNALHVLVSGVVDVVIASSTAGIR